MVAQRICSTCGVIKPLTETWFRFYKPRGAAWGFRSYCKDCDNAARSKRKKERPWINRACNSRRRAKQRGAIPSWANLDAIKHLEEVAHESTRISGITHGTDHWVPLVHDVVCGLHTEHNIAVMPLAVNLQKGNRYWQDMPDLDDPELIAMVREFKAKEGLKNGTD